MLPSSSRAGDGMAVASSRFQGCRQRWVNQPGNGVGMPPQTLENRVEKLETQMLELRELPALVAEVGVQILQLRTEMRPEFSAMRQEIRTGDEETRRSLREEMRAGDETLREEMRAGDETLRQEIRALGATLREEIRTGDATLREEIRTGD